MKKKLPRLFYYEPKPVPVLDRDGNAISYEYPYATPMTLQQSDNLRVKNFPNEKGLSADPANIEGFKALIDTINSNRNLRGQGFVGVGFDDLSTASEILHAESLLKSVQQ